MRKLNWGIIGLGRIAEIFSEGFSEVNSARLLSVASKDKSKLEKFKKIYNLEERFLFERYEDLINCKDIDIVYVALPNSLHYHWVLKIIENNKNVLVEKPAFISSLEADDFYKKIVDKDLFFQEAFMYRYLPQTKSIIEILKNQEIGKISSMNSYFGMNLLTKKKFFFFEKKKSINPKDRKFDKEMGGGSIYDLGCYPSSFSLLINSIISEKKNNNFKISNILKEIGETGVDVDASAELVFDNYFKSKIHCSFKKNSGNQTIINGKNGQIILQDTWKGKNVIIKLNQKKGREINFDNKKNIYSYQIETISNNILKGYKKTEYPGMRIDETIQNARIIDSWINSP
ncbi:Gfo/Idh/MocA family oxidoreductase [Candidatus Pelagibacter sp.]|nr:Gfo/Idh/MocA family oxidoreductase [Candidatus Pelagibacter sp.]